MRSNGLWEALRARENEMAALRAEVERAQREADFLRHAVEELQRLAPETVGRNRARGKAHHHDAGGEGGGRPARCA